MTQKFIIGVILLVTNIPVGWIGAIFFAYCAKKYNKKFYYWLSVLVYALSWLMLFAGIYLCGRDYAKMIMHDYVRKYIVPLVIIFLLIVVVFYLIKKYKKKS